MTWWLMYRESLEQTEKYNRKLQLGTHNNLISYYSL